MKKVLSIILICLCFSCTYHCDNSNALRVLNQFQYETVDVYEFGNSSIIYKAELENWETEQKAKLVEKVIDIAIDSINFIIKRTLELSDNQITIDDFEKGNFSSLKNTSLKFYSKSFPYSCKKALNPDYDGDYVIYDVINSSLKVVDSLIAKYSDNIAIPPIDNFDCGLINADNILIAQWPKSVGVEDFTVMEHLIFLSRTKFQLHRYKHESLTKLHLGKLKELGWM